MQEVIAAYPCDVVFMHHLGVPVSHSALIPLAEDPIAHVYEWAEKRIAYLTSQGINASRLIFDVGIGYGKTAEQSLALLREIAIFKKLGVRLLVGHSRKSFIEAIYQSKPIMRDLETSIISLHLAKEGVDYLRVHNIFEHLRVFNVSTAFAAL
jgi:dihydropteroate synthase